MAENIYDDLDVFYREIWGRSLHHGAWLTGSESIETARENLIEIALKSLNPQGLIADIGCGYGALANNLIQRYDCAVLANTNSQKQAAQIQTSPRIKILQGDWLEQKIAPRSLEGIIAIESLSHFDSFTDFLNHTLPALKPGGRIVICDWYSKNGSDFLQKKIAAIGNLPPWRSADALCSKMEALELKKLHSLNLSKKVAPTWTALFRRSLILPFRRPRLLGSILRTIIRRPSLLLAFPLIRLIYETGDLEYHVICYEK